MKKALAIQSGSGEHFGFILFSGGPLSGNCIFQLLPQNSDAFDDPAFKFLEKFGFRIAGEHRWEVDGNKISIATSTGDTAEVAVDAEELTFNSGPEYRIAKKGTN